MIKKKDLLLSTKKNRVRQKRYIQVIGDVQLMGSQECPEQRFKHEQKRTDGNKYTLTGRPQPHCCQHHSQEDELRIISMKRIST